MNRIVREVLFSVNSRIPWPKKLVILDDYFPNMYQAYRVSEFNYYLHQYPNAQVYSYSPKFDHDIKEYTKHYPQYVGRIHKFKSHTWFKATLFYVVFLHNAYAYLPIFERERRPFILNLYAGGFFGINDPKSDAMLRAVCNSPYLKQIVVSQKNIKEYLIAKKFVEPKKIKFIYGAVPSYVPFERPIKKKLQYPNDKPTFDVCFVAHKHMKNGENKGMDTFLKVANACQQYSAMKFHLLGDVGNNEKNKRQHANVTWHKKISFVELGKFYEKMDVIISPNVANVLHPGSFDGFPTGASREAAYEGVAMMVTDPLKLNHRFKNKSDIVIIKPTVDDIVKKLIYYFEHPTKLYSLAKRGQHTARRIYNYKTQMKKRIAIIEKFL